MKVSLLCICLFICLFCTPVYAEGPYVDLKEAAQNCTFKESSDVSYKISRVIQNKQEKLDSMNHESRKKKNQLIRISSKKRNLDVRYNLNKDKQAVVLLCLQGMYPFSNLYEYFKFNESIIDFRYLYNCKEKVDVMFCRCLRELNRLNREIFTLKKEIGSLYHLQDVLFTRFTNEYTLPKNNGNPNVFQRIQGNFDLPVFGSMHQDIDDKHHSCLSAGVYTLDSYSNSWKKCIENGTISAGTWSYPSGELHLGVDIASPMYTEVRACANGIILYADAPVASNEGYLGNWTGWPAGGGNTLCMVVAVQNQLYAVCLAHLSNQIYVYPGQQVQQGELLALTGNSGNSSGPHTHMEVFAIHTDLPTVVNYFIEGADFSFGNGFKKPATCSDIACRIRPESIDWENENE